MATLKTDTPTSFTFKSAIDEEIVPLIVAPFRVSVPLLNDTVPAVMFVPVIFAALSLVTRTPPTVKSYSPACIATDTSNIVKRLRSQRPHTELLMVNLPFISI